MANFYCVFNAGLNSGTEELGRKYKSVKTLEPVQKAEFVKLEGGTLAECQEAVKNLFPGSTSTPVVVTEAQWKES